MKYMTWQRAAKMAVLAVAMLLAVAAGVWA